MKFNEKQLNAIREYNSLAAGFAEDPSSMGRLALKRKCELTSLFPSILGLRGLLVDLRGISDDTIFGIIPTICPLPESESTGEVMVRLKVILTKGRNVSVNENLSRDEILSDFVRWSQLPNGFDREVEGIVRYHGFEPTEASFGGERSGLYAEAEMEESIGGKEVAHGLVKCFCAVDFDITIR